MTDHPSTFKGEDTHREGVQWDDRAEIHSAEDGQGILTVARDCAEAPWPRWSRK